MVGEDADVDEAVHLQLDEESLKSYWLKYSSRNSFIRVGSAGSNTADRQFSTGMPLKYSLQFV